MSENFDLLSVCGPDLIRYVEGIDFESFVNLKPDQIKEAIPNVIHRIMFENRFERFLKTYKDSINMDVNNAQVITIIDYDELDVPKFDENFELINVSTSSTTVSKSNPDQYQKPLKQSTVIKTIKDITEIPDIKLRIVISKYANKKIPMENSDRITIGKAIMQHLLVNDFERKMPKEEYCRLSELIVQLFPFESRGTYYTPATKGSPAQGKLYSAYQNFRTDLLMAGLISKKEISVSEEKDDEEVESDKRAVLHSDALKLVFESNDDFDQIKIAWKLCYNERQTLVNDLSIFEYMHKFPAFKLPTGYELLILDADTLYPNKKTKLPEVAPKIISYGILKSKNKKSPAELRALAVEYQEASVGLGKESSEFHSLQQITALKILPYLMPNPKRKLSKSEVANFFCPHFKAAHLADSHNSKFNRDNKNSTVLWKPRLYFLGDLLQPKARIHVGNCSYTRDPTDGFDLLFQSYLALKCQYPDETKHVWQFIETEIYEIETSQENQLASVQTFVDDFKYFVDNFD